VHVIGMTCGSVGAGERHESDGFARWLVRILGTSTY
jgi:hypothetical protein